MTESRLVIVYGRGVEAEREYKEAKEILSLLEMMARANVKMDQTVLSRCVWFGTLQLYLSNLGGVSPLRNLAFK